MEESNEPVPVNVPQSPKPLSFTIDFGNTKNVDTQRQKALAEKFQKRHKRGQSLSKLEDSPGTPSVKHPLSGNLPRKSSFQSEGYFSSDEKPERAKSATNRAIAKRSDLTLFLKNVTTDRMTQSFPNSVLPSITSPEIELRDISSPELDMVSPFSPKDPTKSHDLNKDLKMKINPVDVICDNISETSEKDDVFVHGIEVEFDKSDTVSDTGTYTLDAENYSEEQKARMSIDRDFKIEELSVQQKTEEYIKTLALVRESVNNNTVVVNKVADIEVTKAVQNIIINEECILKSPRSPTKRRFDKLSTITPTQTRKLLSPIMSPTQNMSITETIEQQQTVTGNGDHNKTFTKIMFPSPVAKREGLEQNYDQGSVISVTSSGAFKPKPEKKVERKYSLTKSEIQVQAYVDGQSYNDVIVETVREPPKKITPTLTANIVNVQNIEVNKTADNTTSIVSANLTFGKVSPVTTLPPAIGGKTSPTKIPSPIHTLSRPRSRNSLCSGNVDLSDNSLDTDLILKPTQNYINSLTQRLSLDSDQDSDYDVRYGLQLNNTAHLLKQKASHTRHNSLDDRTMNISNKLEHFQNKNLLQSIDQTYSNLFNQYSHNKVINKIQNSPNNSPIRRSSSFSNKNPMNSPKNTNILPQKESNILCNSPNVTRSSSIQRSSSTASIKPNYITNRRSSVTEHHKIDRNQFADTESSSEEDFEKNLQKRKDLSNITNTRCNRTFSLRRARLDNEPNVAKCPNTPEMRRKTFQPELKHQERAISVDRKPMKTNDVQSRYLLNITKRSTPPPVSVKTEISGKNVPRPSSAKKPTNSNNRGQIFSRTDSGRISMRSTQSTKASGANNVPKGLKKDGGEYYHKNICAYFYTKQKNMY